MKNVKAKLCCKLVEEKRKGLKRTHCAKLEAKEVKRALSLIFYQV